MTIAEYYNLPEGTNAKLRYSSFYDTVNSDFPCPPDMFYAFSQQKERSVLKPLTINSATNTSYMFAYCNKLTKIYDIEKWNVSNVTTMEYMFNGCTNLKELDLSNWNTSKVTNMNSAFSSCNSLKCLSSLRADSLTIPSYSSPFGSSNNNTLVDWGGFVNLKSSWNGSYCVDKLTALSHQSLINILNGLYDFVGHSETPTSSQGKIKFGSTHLAKLSEEEKAIATNKGWTLS